VENDREIRLGCLRLASGRLGSAAPINDLFAEARRLLAFVDGFEEIVKTSDGEYAGKRV
jgi:hypothetical protein